MRKKKKERTSAGAICHPDLIGRIDRSLEKKERKQGHKDRFHFSPQAKAGNPSYFVASLLTLITE
jgi:hypothetical protein